MEIENINRGIQESLLSNDAYMKTSKYYSVTELFTLLKERSLPDGWTYIHDDNKIILSFMKYSPAPKICSSLTVALNLQCEYYVNKIAVKDLNSIIFPKIVDNINKLINILEKLSPLQIKENKFKIIADLIAETVEECEDDKKKVLEFILDQLKLLCVSKQQFRYSISSMILFSLLHTISPHAYKFLRSTGYVLLPHPRTIQRLCSTLTTNILNDNDAFLKKRSNLLQESDRTVIVMMDEIYIKPYLGYKGGNIVGMAENSKNLATTAHVLMVQSLLSSYKEVVKILPIKNIAAEDLYKVILNTIQELENLNFFVIGMVSDNNAVNKKAVSFFASPLRLNIIYCHPVDVERPLFMRLILCIYLKVFEITGSIKKL